MKKVIIAIPEGYKFLQIEVPDEMAPFVHTKALKNLPNGMTRSYVVIDDTLDMQNLFNKK